MTGEVVPLFSGRELINGESVDLSRMTLQELVALGGECLARLEEAKLDYAIVADAVERRRQNDGGPS